MKIAIYARVSTLNKGQDVDMQLVDLQKFSASKDWTIFKEYIDKGVSGSKSSRPALDRLMKDAALGLFDAVLVWKLDRFGRSVRHLANSIAELQSQRVTFISLKDSIDLSTAQGRLMFSLLSAMSEFERELICERVKAGMANARRKGKKIGRPSVNIIREDIVSLKASGATWEDVSDAAGCSISTAKRAYRVTVENKADQVQAI
jgi:DNA invertase Pin-like site-specific DNA recombinase